MSNISTQTVSTLNGLFKDQYVGNLENLVNPENYIMSEIGFDSANKNGGDYRISVLLNREHGKTYLGQEGEPRDLNAPISSTVKQANIKASSIMMQSALTIQAAARAATNKQAFASATKYIVQSLFESHNHVQEYVHLYGQSGLGTFTAATDDLNDNKITIDSAEFAFGIWRGAESMEIDIYDAAGNTLVLSTKINAVDLVNRTLTLQSVSGLTDTVSYKIFDHEARGSESKGLQSIMTETSDLFGISPTQYERWAPNNYDASAGKLTYPVWSAAFAQAQGRGLGTKGQEIQGVLSYEQFRNLIPNLDTIGIATSGATTGARRLEQPGNVRVLEHGTEKITFMVGNVKTTIQANAYIKNGLAFFLDKSTWKRVGSSQVGFDIPGAEEGQEYFRRRQGTNYLEIATFGDEALFCNNNARNLLISNLTI